LNGVNALDKTQRMVHSIKPVKEYKGRRRL